MAYELNWKNETLDNNKATPIIVDVGTVVADKASLKFTGRGAPSYGEVQQENLMRLLESFADSEAPEYPTIGQAWFDTSRNILKICIGVDADPRTGVWKLIGGIQDLDTPPTPAALGDMWFQRSGPLSGGLFMYTGTGRYPSGLGGWNQVWPAVETIAGREEYDSVLAMVNELIGPAIAGGSGALGKSLPNLPDLVALDALLTAKYQETAPANAPTVNMKVDTIGSDWDLLLAAAKYAVSRLDLPAEMIEDISPVPFVSDGRFVPAELLALPESDVRYPTLDRRSNRRFGIVTMIRAFTETVNVLKAAKANRYALKGISGVAGTNTAFAPTTQIVSHASFSGSPAGETSETVTLRFKFAEGDMESFLNSGGAIQATMSHAFVVGTNSATDVDFRDLFNSRGIMRFTADKARIFSNNISPVLAGNPTSPGIKDAPAGGHVLTTQTLGSATVTVLASTISATELSLTVTLSGGVITGLTTISFEIIKDTTRVGTTDSRVYGAPMPYDPSDKTGSAFLN